MFLLVVQQVLREQSNTRTASPLSMLPVARAPTPFGATAPAQCSAESLQAPQAHADVPQPGRAAAPGRGNAAGDQQGPHEGQCRPDASSARLVYRVESKECAGHALAKLPRREAAAMSSPSQDQDE